MLHLETDTGSTERSDRDAGRQSTQPDVRTPDFGEAAKYATRHRAGRYGPLMSAAISSEGEDHGGR